MNQSINIDSVRKKMEQSPGPPKTDVSESTTWAFLNKEIRIGSALPDKVKETFYLELGTLLASTIDIRTALTLITDSAQKKTHKIIFEKVLNSVIAGSTLSAAMIKNTEFSPYEYFSVQIGEETGKLSSVLQELAVYFKKKIKQKQQIIGALTYPILVLTVAIGAVGFMISFVVPMFADVFKRFGGELPAITRLVLSVADMSGRFATILLLGSLTVVIFCFVNRKKDWFRNISTRIILKIPIIGSLVLKIYLTRLCTSMALLIGSRIALTQSLQLVKQMITFFPFEVALKSMEEKIINGSSLYTSLAEHKIFPRKMVAMLKAGEEVNQQELFFSKLSDQYSNELEYQTGILSKFLEPVIIITLGLVVGVILIAMYLPLFKLGQTF